MAKGLGSQMSAPAIQSGIDRKLHRLARPAYSGVLVLAEKLRDVKVEAGGQRPADAKIEGLRSGGLGSESQKNQVQSLNQEVLDQQG